MDQMSNFGASVIYAILSYSGYEHFGMSYRGELSRLRIQNLIMYFSKPRFFLEFRVYIITIL